MNKILHKTKAENMNFDWFDLFDKFVKNLALIGATWLAYRKFFKGRVYKVKIEPSLSYTVRQNGETTELLVTARIKNVGIFSAPLPKGGVPLQIFVPQKTQKTMMQDVKWADFDMPFILFADNHNTIESGETVSEDILLSIPSDVPKALKLHMTVITPGENWFFFHDLGGKFSAEKIVLCDEPNDNNP